jgi:hypothetical protein
MIDDMMRVHNVWPSPFEIKISNELFEADQEAMGPLNDFGASAIKITSMSRYPVGFAACLSS